MSWITNLIGDIENNPVARKVLVEWLGERYREETKKEKKEKRQPTKRAADFPKRPAKSQEESDSEWATKVISKKRANR